MAPQLGWIGLGNMGRVRLGSTRFENEADICYPGHVQEPCREGQAVRATAHLQSNKITSGRSILEDGA